MKASYTKHLLQFKTPSKTSRETLLVKETWLISIEENGKIGVGECAMFRGLSIDDRPDFEQKLALTCQNITLGEALLWQELSAFPAIQFGVEMAFLALKNNAFEFFPSDFTQQKKPININGLIWMGDEIFMKKQIQDKIAEGFTCLKLKIGGIAFEKELALLAFIRNHFSASEIEIRVDANGAFDPKTALQKLKQLAVFELHSIEQPISKNNLSLMSNLCQNSPLPIALDEELIGVFGLENKENLLTQLKPQYIVLKPSFIGGYRGTTEWINLAQKHHVGWWITSALESNIGLNAIAQFTFLQKNNQPQGLGTGALFSNNFESPLYVKNGKLWFKK